MRGGEIPARPGRDGSGAAGDQKARRCPLLCYDAGVTVAQPALARRLFRPLLWAVGLALPPRCLGCGMVLGQDDSLCPTCWAKFSFIAAPRCAACGVPFELQTGDDMLCAPCVARRPAFAEARAAVVYDDLPRRILMRFKYGGRPHLARLMARQIRLAAGAWLDEEDVILVPVPLARWRLWRRGYNQAGLIANALARISRAEALPAGLVRQRATRTSGGLTRSQRFANVRGAFRLGAGIAERIRGRAVIVVDDVVTSGATADACAAALLKGGASSVRVLSWARTLLEPAPGKGLPIDK